MDQLASLKIVSVQRIPIVRMPRPEAEVCCNGFITPMASYMVNKLPPAPFDHSTILNNDRYDPGNKAPFQIDAISYSPQQQPFPPLFSDEKITTGLKLFDT